MPESTLQPPTKPPAKAFPRRKRRNFVGRLIFGLSNAIRQFIAPDQLISNLKTIGWVIPMSVLIWIYAEREQNISGTVEFRLEARNNDKSRSVTINVGSDKGLVRAELTGPQKQFEQVRDFLSGGLQIDLPASDAGRYTRTAQDLLANNDLFVRNGQTIKVLSPQSVTVVVDSMEQVDLDVTAPPTVTNLEGPPTFTPSHVTVTGPKSVLASVRAAGLLYARADIDDRGDPGLRNVPNAKLIVPALENDPRVTVSVRTVSALYTIKTTETTLHGVSVMAIYPPTPVWDKFKAQLPANVPLVKVIGPPEGIEAITRPDSPITPKAIVDLTTADPPIGATPVKDSEHKAKIHFDFGNTGLKVTSDTQDTVTFTITTRQPSDN